MKKYLYIAASLLLTITMQAQDRPMPKQGPAPSINIKKPVTFVLENGLKVLVVENNYVNSNSTVEGIAENLASYYLLYGDINLVNTEIEIYRSITREDIKEVAKKYLNPNQRLILNYGPAKEKTAK